MDYQEIDIADNPSEGRLYVVPHDDGASLLFKEPDGPEREIFMTTAEVEKFFQAVSPSPAAQLRAALAGAGSALQAISYHAADHDLMAVGTMAGAALDDLVLAGVWPPAP